MRRQKLIVGLLGLLSVSIARGQYYYSDLVGIQQVEQKQQLYKKIRVRQIKGTAILPTGDPQTDFQENTWISSLADTLQQEQFQQGSNTVLSLYFSGNGQLTEQWEKRGGFSSRITYTRNKNGDPTQIENYTSDSLSEFQQREIHRWEYDEKNSPVRMWRILEKEVGQYDTTEIRFLVDTAGLVTEERSFKRGRETGFFYYYYNDARQITDIVRFNPKLNRLLPDQLLEYDEAGKLIQRMQLTGSRDVTYLLFRYGYQSNGLINEEALFNNKKEHTGSIRFSYTNQRP